MGLFLNTEKFLKERCAFEKPVSCNVSDLGIDCLGFLGQIPRAKQKCKGAK